MNVIIIVKDGHWGNTKEGDYDEWCKMLRGYVEDEGAEAKILTLRQAQYRVRENHVDAVVFVTRGMIVAARSMKLQNPELRIVLFVGLPPKKGEYPWPLDDLIIIDKMRLAKEPFAIVIKEAVFGEKSAV